MRDIISTVWTKSTRMVWMGMCSAAILLAGCNGGAGSTPEPPDDGADGPPGVHPEAWPEHSSPIGLNPDIEARVGEILAAMSVEEKVGQVMQPEIRHIQPEEVREYHIGSVLNGGGGFPNSEKYSTPEDWVALADAFWEASMDTSDDGQAIPIIWGVDAVHGHNNVIGATLFPHNVGLGAANNPELLREIGRVTAREVAVTGQDWDFGPTVAVAREGRWGRAYESYSEAPDIVNAYAGQMVRGLQGEPGEANFLDREHVISTAKHFLGDGGTVKGVDQGDNIATEADLRDIHAAGYFSALDAGVQTVMASFNSWHGKKMHGYEELLTDVLKERMGFDGFVVGDWNGHGQVAGCTNESCAQSFNAGVDMFMVPEDWKALYENTLEQVRLGEITMERLDDAVRRILRVKMRAGLFERGKPSSRPLALKKEILGSAEHREVARRAVRESLVLLKNAAVGEGDGAGQLLPLAPGQRVLVAGDGADDIGKQSGGWTISWQGTGNSNADFPGGTSIWAGLRDAIQAAGGTVELSPNGSYSTKPDAAVVVYGEDPYAEFQGDREHLIYSLGTKKADVEMLRRLRADGVPVVSVFLTGRPLWTNPEINASDAFVVAWLPGTEGVGVADVLVAGADGAARHDFRGKLSFSWPKRTDQLALNRGDADYDPLFAYGYGLTYGDGASTPGELSEDLGDIGALASAKIYFAGGPVPPWTLEVADADGEAVVETGSQTTTASGNLQIQAIDRKVQEDARSARWTGGGAAHVALRGADPIDLLRESNGDLLLGFDVRLDEAPSSKVEISMGCGDGCAGTLDVTDELAGSPLGQWISVSVRLRCFADVGADMTKIDVPFQVSTDGSLGLSFAEIRLVTLSGGGNTECP